MFGVDVANITRMLIVYTQGVVGFGIADQAGLPWKYFEDFSNRVIKPRDNNGLTGGKLPIMK